MAKRGEVWKDVPSNTIEDTVKRLQTRMNFLEQDMYMVLKEIYSLKEIVMNKKKKENDDIPYEPKKKQQILVENESPKKKNKDESPLLRE